MALNEKQQVFCDEYLIDLNATQAALRAGYSKDTSYSYGQQLLKHIECRTYIQAAMDERSKNTMIDAAFVIENLKKVAGRCLQAEPVMKFNFATSLMEQVKDNDGNNVWEFDSQGANKAMELLGKHLGVFEKDNRQKSKDPVDYDGLINLAQTINGK